MGSPQERTSGVAQGQQGWDQLMAGTYRRINVLGTEVRGTETDNVVIFQSLCCDPDPVTEGFSSHRHQEGAAPCGCRLRPGAWRKA